MSLGEIVKTALIDTALGMGTVFVILVIISIVIWALGRTAGEANPKKITAKTDGNIAAAGETDPSERAELSGAETAQPSVNKDGLTPEMVAAIATVAINQYLRDQKGTVSADEYVVRNIRRANWRHS